MIANDPTEAVRSEELVAFTEQHFDVRERKNIGGTILQHLLYDIVQNFRFDDPRERSLLEMLCTIEAMLVDSGRIPCDFVLLAARKKGSRVKRANRPLPPRAEGAEDVERDPLRESAVGGRRSAVLRGPLDSMHHLRLLRLALLSQQPHRANLFEESAFLSLRERFRARGRDAFDWLLAHAPRRSRDPRPPGDRCYTRPRVSDAENSLYDRITGALVWIAAFCLATGVFLSITLLFNALPPTAPVAIGAVTIERYSKLRDYLGAALFFLLVPPLTIWLRRVLGRATRRLRTMGERVLFTVPYLLSPLFYLTTGKVGWILLLPIALSLTGPRAAGVRAQPPLDPRAVPPRARPVSRAAVLPRRCRGCSIATWSPAGASRTSRRSFSKSCSWRCSWRSSGPRRSSSRGCASCSSARRAEEIFRRITVAALPLVVLPFLAGDLGAAAASAPDQRRSRCC